MTDNDQLLEKFGNLIDQKLEPMKRDMATKQDVTQLEQRMAPKQDVVHLNTSLAQTRTILEAIAAGQKELQETVATKADIQDLRADLGKKVKKHDERLDALEELTGASNPHKN